MIKIKKTSSFSAFTAAITPEFKPGDPRPKGYVAYYEWADIQIKAGIFQKRCKVCGLWKFPQDVCDCVQKQTISKA